MPSSFAGGALTDLPINAEQSENSEDEEEGLADCGQLLMAVKALLLQRDTLEARSAKLILSGWLLPQAQAFSSLRHLTVTLFRRQDVKQLCGLASLVTLSINAQFWWPGYRESLQPLTGLKQLSLSGSLPQAVLLPAGCKCHLRMCEGMSRVFGCLLVTAPWLTHLELELYAVGSSGADPSSLEGRQERAAESLLQLDVKIETVTLLVTADLGSRLSPLRLHGTAHSLITQATNFTLVCKSAWLEIPRDVRVAWQKVKFLAEGKLSVFYDVVPLPHEVLMFELPIKHLQESNLPFFVSAWSGAAQSSGHEATMASYLSDIKQWGKCPCAECAACWPAPEICRILFCRDRVCNAQFLEAPQCIQALWPCWRTGAEDNVCYRRAGAKPRNFWSMLAGMCR